MLKLKEIIKDYVVADDKVEALKGVSLDFRKSEFVSILGQSGCGKTTLLNIIGGLDRYTSGDLVINGISTKEYSDSDWDSYRNHSIGFVFQNYNLIPHLTVLGNVELALTLSGVSNEERKRRSIEALEKVGLKDQINKKPNQMSGGQMQRVAIARALVNNPEIILADEPTGALDTQTSIQVMEILKEISKEKLIIMVTHNPELANTYSSRIIKLLDGKVIDDSNPFVDKTEKNSDKTSKEKKKERKKTSMSFFTALSLSAKNLLTKKGRTILTAFAGSIGIIGVALVLALSNGFQTYVDKMQTDTLSTYPLTISSTTMDLQAALTQMGGVTIEKFPNTSEVVINKVNEQLESMIVNNNLDQDFINYLENNIDSKYLNGIMYDYGIDLNIYGTNKINGELINIPTTYSMSISNPLSSNQAISEDEVVWQELLNNNEFLLTQYDLLKGAMPQSKNEVILVVDQYNRIPDYVLEALGLYNSTTGTATNLSFDELLNLKFYVGTNDDLFVQNEEGYFDDYSNDMDTISDLIANEKMIELSVVGIVRVKEDTTGGFITGTIGYHADLTEYLRDKAINSDIIKWMKDPLNKYKNPFTNLYYADINGPDFETNQTNYAICYTKYNSDLTSFGGNEKPLNISIYPVDFQSKEEIKSIISEYKGKQYDAIGGLVCDDEGNPVLVGIVYTDVMELMVNSLNTVISSISYVLIAFTAISLVVSSIMIGIITYVSVIERTKEIGILRAIGARKKDISRVFNAETVIIGFSAGLFGIIVTYLLSLPINIILKLLTDISGIASLNPLAAVVLILISIGLTFVAGLFPAKIAAKKDPVVALRTE